MLLMFILGSVLSPSRISFLQETVLSQGFCRTRMRLSGKKMMKVNVNIVRGGGSWEILKI